MLADPNPLVAHNTAPVCYFSIAISPSTHFSLETPSTTPASDYSFYTPADPTNPLLAFRPAPPPESMSSPADASRLLQLQTQAAHRPSAEPVQQNRSSSASPSNSSDSSSSSSRTSRSGSATLMSPSVLSCCRCRRESLTGMYQFGTNLYYCSHCARMVGYSAG